MTTFGKEGRCNYISSIQRDDVKRLLREQLKRFEAHENQREVNCKIYD